MDISEAQARLEAKQKQNESMKSLSVSSPEPSQETHCDTCGEVNGMNIALLGMKKFQHRECRCRREVRELQEEADRIRLEGIRAENRDRLVRDTTNAILAATPPMYQGIALDAKLKPWFDAFTGEQWLVLKGGQGRGKTTQAWTLARSIAERGHLLRPADNVTGWSARDCAAWNVPDWLAQVRRAFDTDEPPDLETPWLLILDDLGAERVKKDSDGDSWAREQLYRVVNKRWEWKRPTIITTNLDGAELAEKYEDKRIPDRIFDVRLTTVVTLTGQSWRRRGEQING